DRNCSTSFAGDKEVEASDEAATAERREPNVTRAMTLASSPLAGTRGGVGLDHGRRNCVLVESLSSELARRLLPFGRMRLGKDCDDNTQLLEPSFATSCQELKPLTSPPRKARSGPSPHGRAHRDPCIASARTQSPERPLYRPGDVLLVGAFDLAPPAAPPDR